MINISIKSIYEKLRSLAPEWFVGAIAAALGTIATVVAYAHGTIVAYGDAESHLNIAKRVIDGLTPGMAQLGGIWLPLPHILLIPFVANDYLWRTGLAGAIISGLGFVISAIFIYKIIVLLTENIPAAFFGALVFMVNPNILYMQATPMTELTLIAFFILSTYYFLKFLYDRNDTLALIAAAFFGFCASLSRYDGWGLVLMEAGLLFLAYFPYRFWRKARAGEAPSWKSLEGTMTLFCTLAFFGVALWLMWGWLILGDPLYFTHSEFSAKSQQESWLQAGALPGYHNLAESVIYYAYTTLSNLGILVVVLAIIGCIVFLLSPATKHRWYVLGIFSVPFIFNVATLYLGQSVIFIPGLTPGTFQWNLFNVRYGVLMVPFASVFLGYLVSRFRTAWIGSAVGVGLALQCAIFAVGYAPVITLADGTSGLSSAVAKVPDAQYFLAANYDSGLVLEDDYSRTISIIHTPIPMKSVIYIGSKPYWQESLKEPEKYARWIVMQRNDTVWKSIYDDPVVQGRLFKYFNKVYTSEDIYIFKRIAG